MKIGELMLVVNPQEKDGRLLVLLPPSRRLPSCGTAWVLEENLERTKP